MRLFCQLMLIGVVVAGAAPNCSLGRAADVPVIFPNAETTGQDVGFAIGGPAPALLPTLSSECSGPLQPSAPIVPVGFAAPDAPRSTDSPPGQSSYTACDAVTSCDE